MRLLNLLTACVALLLGTASVQAQLMPRAIGEWEATAAFRALDRPNPQETNVVIFREEGSGATLLDSNTLVDLNIGLGPDIAFSTTREDGLDYELRFFFTNFSRSTLTQADSITSPFFTGGVLTTREVNGSYTSDMFNIELNQKRIFNQYVRLLHGIRFMHIEEELEFLSTGVLTAAPATGFTASSVSRAKNPMLGYQLGGESRIVLVPGMDMEGYFKCGIYNNFSNQSTSQSVNLLPGTVVSSGSENELGLVSDFGVKFHLNVVDNFMSIFAGYDGMYVNSFAAAPANVNLSNSVVNDLDFWLHGITFGLKVVR